MTAALVSGLVMAALERRGRIVQGRRYDPSSGSATTGDKGQGNSACSCEEGRPEETERPGGRPSGEGIVRRIFVKVPRRAWMLGKDIGLYLLIGILLAALPKAYVDPEMVSRYLGDQAGVGGIFMALPISALIEACSEGFAVVAGQLYEQGATLAVVFVMTMVGVATDVTELTMLWKKFGRRTTLSYLAIGTSVTLFFGLMLHGMVYWATR